ncbi:MAG: 6,7-dimethyl-8-ribityllumazine synthase [Elusimicrobiota bacterium]
MKEIKHLLLNSASHKNIYKKSKVAIVVARFNAVITENLLTSCKKELIEHGVSERNIYIQYVPGAFELPFVSSQLAKTRKFNSVITLGCVIKGETSHDLFVSSWASIGVGMASLESGIPILFGVLTPNNEKQALVRSRPGPKNRGREVGLAALEMMFINKGR